MRTRGAVLPGWPDRAVRPRDPDLRRLLGEAAWLDLPAAVRARFAVDHHRARTSVYAGRMHIRSSRAGRWLARACLACGLPIAPPPGDDVPTSVLVYAGRRDGVVWERCYLFPRRTSIVRSTKRLDASGELLECLGAGLRMRLAVSARGGSLYFDSVGYALELGALHIELPGWLSPGQCHVTHTDLGGGRFRFTMSLRHRWLGELYFQEGEFHDPGVEPC